MDINALFEKFNSLKILVVGDVMVDSYLFGKVDRISPEAPVPVVALEKKESRLGGAANVALNLKSMGASVSVASVIGNDEHGKNLLQLFELQNIDTSGIVSSSGRRTTVKHRVIGNNLQLLRVDDEITTEILPEEDEAMIKFISENAAGFDALIFEDYDKGVLHSDNIGRIITICEKAGIPTIVDPKKRNFLAYKKATLFKPNLKEIKEGLKIDGDLKEEKALKAAVRQMEELLQNSLVMVTLSERGVVITDQTEWHQIPAHIRNIADVSGAGDTVVSVAALCLAAGCEMRLIAELSNLAGGLVCEKVGVVPIDKNELLQEAKKLIQ